MPSTSFFAAVLAAASVLPQLALGQTIDDGSDTVGTFKVRFPAQLKSARIVKSDGQK